MTSRITVSATNGDPITAVFAPADGIIRFNHVEFFPGPDPDPDRDDFINAFTTRWLSGLASLTFGRHATSRMWTIEGRAWQTVVDWIADRENEWVSKQK